MAMRRPETAYERWRPCRDRFEVCRRPGCLQPAVVEVLGLCEGCLSAYRSEHSLVLAEREAKRAKTKVPARPG